MSVKRVLNSAVLYVFVMCLHSGAVRASAFTTGDPGLALTNALKTPERKCQLAYLQSLGWRVILSKSGRAEVIDGMPCNRDSLSESQALGELTIGLPSDPSAADMDEVVSIISNLMKSTSTICAYKFKVAAAASLAIRKLQANKNYGFSLPREKQTGLIKRGFVDVGIFSRFKLGWSTSAGPTYARVGISPSGSNSRAIESFYTKEIRAECAAGLQLSQHAINYELYGREDYDRAFRRDEIVIGTWDAVSYSNSAIHGRRTGPAPSDSMGVRSAFMGGNALVGRTAYLGNVFGEKFLDKPDDRGENLLIVSITPEASIEIASANGLKKYNDMFRRAWDLRTENAKLSAVNAADPQILANDREVAQIYANPFFTGIHTYTHPFRTLKTFKGQAERLWKLNPRTPYSLSFYSDVINHGLYQRHQNYFVNKCLNSGR